MEVPAAVRITNTHTQRLAVARPLPACDINKQEKVASVGRKWWRRRARRGETEELAEREKMEKRLDARVKVAFG